MAIDPHIVLETRKTQEIYKPAEKNQAFSIILRILLIDCQKLMLALF